MAFHPSDSSYKSPPPRMRHSQQSQTYRTASNQPYLNSTGETLPQNGKAQSPSVRLRHGKSLGLLSRISKFEALDALSVPFEIPSLRPAHLQMSWNSTSGKETERTRTRRLSTIFSPTSQSLDKYTTFPSDEEVTSGRETLGSTTSKKWFAPQRTDSRRLRKSHASLRSSNVRIPGGIWKYTDVTEGKGTGDMVASYGLKEVPSRKMTIREMIRLYDGSTDKKLAKAASKNTHAKSSMPIATQTAPLLRKRTSDIKLYSDTSTTSSRRRLITERTVAPKSPTKPYKSVGASQRQLLHEPHTPNFIFSPRHSRSKSSIGNVSPRTVLCSKACHHCGATTEKLPIRGTPNRDAASNNRPEEPTSGARRRISPGEDRGRANVRTADRGSSTRVSLDRRRITNKIEELYRAKSLERNHDTLREVDASQVEATAGTTSVAQEHIPRHTELPKELGIMKSRVADMKKKFEGSVVGRAPIAVVPPSLPSPFFSNSSPFSKVGKVISETSVPSSPPLPSVFLPCSDTRMNSHILPELVQETPAVDARKFQSISDNQEPPAPIATTQKQRTTRSSNIRDRINLFESIQGTKKPEHETIKSSYTRKLRASLKSLFELTSRKSNEAGAGGELSSKGVQNIIDAHQGTEVTLTVGEQNTLVGRWNIVPQVPPSSGTDGAMSERGIGSPRAEGVKEMIVKEVECGLKQPKPVRVTERKRMILLCRERAGGIMDKERSRIVQSRKL